MSNEYKEQQVKANNHNEAMRRHSAKTHCGSGTSIPSFYARDAGLQCGLAVCRKLLPPGEPCFGED